MVVSGLGLLLGERADSGLVRAGRRRPWSRASCSVPAGHPALVRADEAGADVERRRLVLARTVAADGRSRAHVGGRSTPVGVLTEIGETLVAVHGQADQWRLRQGDQHREVLDDVRRGARRRRPATHTGRPSTPCPARAPSATGCGTWPTSAPARSTCSRRASNEIEALDPQPGEDVALRAEDERLAHADGLRLAAAQAHAYLVGDDGYASDAAAPVADALSAARAALSPVTDHDAGPRASWRAASPSWPTSPPTWRPTCRPTSPTSTSTPPGWPRSSSDGPTSRA